MSTADLYAQPATMEVEDLETRKMLSSVTLEDGILVVQGDNTKSNTISVTMVGGKIQATAGRAKLTVAAAKVIAMSITGGNKADVIDVSPLVKLGAYIDAKGGNDVIRTGSGNDTVVGGDGDDQVINRGGKDQIYGGAGKNRVQAGKKDTVYAGTGKSTVTGTTNRSLKDPKPVIPPPPTQKPPAVTEQTDSNPQQTQDPPPGGTIDQSPVDAGGSNGDDGGQQQQQPQQQQQQDPQPPVVVPPPDGTDNPPAPQDPGGLSGDPPPQQDPQPPVVVTVTLPTLYARDFGAKFDGVTDDGPAIQAAVDALPADGGTVVIDGLAAVRFTAIHLNGRDSVTIRAAKPGDGFVSLPGPDKATWNFFSVVITLTDCTNCTVSGLTFDGAGNIGGGVGLNHCTDSTVTGNTLFHMAGGAGAIAAAAGLGNTYSYNSIHDTYDGCRGIWIGNVGLNDMETDPLVQGNTILRCGGDGIAGHHAGAVIRDNVVRDCMAAGIALGGYFNASAGYDAVTKDCLIEDNVFSGNLFHGIQSDVYAGEPFTLRITIRGNLCEGNVGAGIYAIRVQDWVIEDNVCRDNGVGISVSRASNLIIRGNTCTGTHAPGTTIQSVGIDVVANPLLAGNASDVATGQTLCDQNILIEGNICTGSSMFGIKLDSQNAGKVSSVQILNNTCTGNQLDGLYVNSQQAGQFTNVTCDGNSCTGNARINLNVTLL